jgi:hypothetical protein
MVGETKGRKTKNEKRGWGGRTGRKGRIERGCKGTGLMDEEMKG